MPHAHIDVSVSINASAQTVFDRIQDLSRFNDWNPFPSMDPTSKSTNQGPDAGVGAIFNYQGDKMGKGRMEISSVDAPRKVDIDMTFWNKKGVPDSATSGFEIVDGPGDTVIVHWLFDQDRGLGMWLGGKLFFDRMMGGTFTKGLENLKVLVEAGK